MSEATSNITRLLMLHNIDMFNCRSNNVQRGEVHPGRQACDHQQEDPAPGERSLAELRGGRASGIRAKSRPGAMSSGGLSRWVGNIEVMAGRVRCLVTGCKGGRAV
jgi:hypothetical protein